MAIMKCIKLLLIVFVIGFSTNINASTVKGVASCGNWNRFKGMPVRHEYEAWLAGYISGVSVGTNTDFLVGADVISFALWMDEYCKKHSSEYISEGANALIKKLIEKMYE